MKHPRVSILLPTYNEAGNITVLIKNIMHYAPVETEIIVVDDNSPDHTARLAKQYVDTHQLRSRVRIIKRRANRGLTNSLIDGITNARGTVILWLDCDFSHPPEIIPKLLRAIDHDADIAIASRFHNEKKSNSKKKQPQAQNTLSRMLNTVLSVLFGTGITDYTTGFLAARKKVLAAIPLRGNYGEYCVDLLVRAQQANYHIVEIPFSSPPRRSGDSKTAPDTITLLRHGSGYLLTLLRLLWSHKLFRRINHT